jgi:hypothetical protein
MLCSRSKRNPEYGFPMNRMYILAFLSLQIKEEQVLLFFAQAAVAEMILRVVRKKKVYMVTYWS